MATFHGPLKQTPNLLTFFNLFNKYGNPLHLHMSLQVVVATVEK